MPPYNNDYRYDYTFAYPDYATTATTYTGNRLVWNTTTETTRPTLSVGEIDSLIDIKIKEAFEKLYKKLKEITDMQITEEEFLHVLTE